MAGDSQTVALARDAYEAFNRGDLSAVLERCDTAIEWRMSDRFTRGSRVFHGHDGVREVYETFQENFDGFRTEPEEFLEVGPHIVVPVRLIGRPRGGDADVEIALVQVWTHRDNRVIRLEVFPDRETALAALAED